MILGFENNVHSKIVLKENQSHRVEGSDYDT